MQEGSSEAFSRKQRTKEMYFTEHPSFTLRVFGVLPMVPLVANICTIGTDGSTILPFAQISLPMAPLLIKLVPLENPEHTLYNYHQIR